MGDVVEEECEAAEEVEREAEWEAEWEWEADVEAAEGAADGDVNVEISAKASFKSAQISSRPRGPGIPAKGSSASRTIGSESTSNRVKSGSMG